MHTYDEVGVMKIIQPRHIPIPVREALALRDLLIRCGFRSDSITAWLHHDRITVQVMVVYGVVSHNIDCETFGDEVTQDFFYDWWARGVRLWDDKLADMTMTAKSREIIVRKSRFAKEGVMERVLIDMSEAGIKVPEGIRRVTGLIGSP